MLGKLGDTIPIRKRSKNPIRVGSSLFCRVWYPYHYCRRVPCLPKRRNKAQERQEQAAKRAPYASDLSDAEWKLIAPLFEREKKDGRGRAPSTPFREIVDALCYLSRTGCQWRMLPHDYPDWHFVYQWFRQWCGDETLVKINAALRKQIRIEDGRSADPSLGIIDAQSVKSTAVAGVRGFDGGKKVTGVKRHIVVDSLGLILVAVVHSAGIHDNQGAFLALCPMFPCAFPRLVKIMADGGYAVHGSALRDWLLQTKGWTLEIVHRIADAGFKILPQNEHLPGSTNIDDYPKTTSSFLSPPKE